MSVRILTGDCRTVLQTLADESVNCVVTSPPYFGLRDYGMDGQIGLEPTPDAFVVEMVAVFREVRRVLRKDGTLWLNLGDSYAGGGRGGGAEGCKQRTNAGSLLGPKKAPDGLKPKDLMGIPWRVAFALQADGWWLRQDIIWHKPNPMPESITDRCTKAHEYLFLLTKGERYAFDAKAIAETCVSTAPAGNKVSATKGRIGGGGGWDASPKSDRSIPADGRNKRSVWTVQSSPFPEAHFATFPPDLIEPCIKAGCPVGGTVLDPFGGAGTTGLVADRLSRNAILIELNPTYATMARDRLARDGGMFASLAAE